MCLKTNRNFEIRKTYKGSKSPQWAKTPRSTVATFSMHEHPSSDRIKLKEQRIEDYTHIAKV